MDRIESLVFGSLDTDPCDRIAESFLRKKGMRLVISKYIISLEYISEIFGDAEEKRKPLILLERHISSI